MPGDAAAAGVITLTVVTAGSLPAGAAPPLWVIAAGLTMALGTYTGGWRIIRTLGTGLTRLGPRQGCVAWVLTLPAAGIVAALAVLLTEQDAWGQDTTAALLLCATLAFRARSRRTAVTARSVAPETAARLTPAAQSVT